MTHDARTDLTEEAESLLNYFQDRDLTPREACILMGAVLTTIINDKTEARQFVRKLAQELDQHIQ